MLTQIAQLATVAERLLTAAYAPPVDHEIYVKRVTQVGRNDLREFVLELFVVESGERKPEFPIRPDSGERSPNVRVGGKNLASE
jgi:hypothetical protein